MIKANASGVPYAKKLKDRTKGKRVKRAGVKQPGSNLGKHGVASNIPVIQ